MANIQHVDANKNERRSIRRKAKTLCITDGEVFYIRTNGSEVSLDEMTRLANATILVTLLTHSELMEAIYYDFNLLSLLNVIHVNTIIS